MYGTPVITPKYYRYAENGTQQGAAHMGLPAGRNTSAMPARVRGSAASLRGTGASSTDEQEGKEDKGEGDLDRELKVLDQGELGERE